MVPRLLVALLLVTAGCTAVDEGAQSPSSPTVPVDQPPTSTHSPTSTQPTPTHSVTTSPPIVTSPPPSEANTVAYEALSATQQRAFDRALEGQVQFVDESALDSPYVGDEYYATDVADPFRAYAYVRKNGSLYRLSYREGGGEALASYGIEATREEPSADESVVALENLSTKVREPVRWAVENGSYGVPAGKWYSLPQEFDRFDYVRYEGETYRISIMYGDLFADRLHVEPAEE